MTREQLIICYYPLVKHVVNSIYKTLPKNICLNYDDFVSLGTIGLIKAIDNFDDSKNVLFKSYAIYRIRGHILDGLRNIDSVSREQRHKLTEIENLKNQLSQKHMRNVSTAEVLTTLPKYYKLHGLIRSISLEDYHEDIGLFVDKNELIISTLERQQLISLLNKAIKTLSIKDRKTLKYYFYKNWSMRQIAERYGCTEGYIWQSLRRIRKKLKEELKNHYETKFSNNVIRVD